MSIAAIGSSSTGSVMQQNEFDVEGLQRRLEGLGINWRIHFLPEVDSTNRVAMKCAMEGAPDGTVIIADYQTAGRGRLQRVWQSPPGRNLYASFLLRPAIVPADAAQITLMAGVAVADMVSIFCPEGVGLKWPNDVRIRGRKVCGILTEMKMIGRGVDAVVVGTGVNVNMVREDFDPAHRESATSLQEETGRPLLREEVAFSLCRRLEEWYRIFQSEGFMPVRAEWLARSEMEGSHVRVIFRDEVQEGLCTGIDSDGALLLVGASGSVQRITAGDASIVKG
jgi:BirA family biotin operon repressor/biotin-[acetyl-CoA-carboxylase] ligase